MKRRDIRAARLDAVEAKRMPASMERYVPLLAPLPANDEDPQGDEADDNPTAEDVDYLERQRRGE